VSITELRRFAEDYMETRGDAYVGLESNVL
jgi:hypothetical protein